MARAGTMIGGNKITAEYLKEHCRQNDLYPIPRLNTILYLHRKVATELLLFTHILAALV